MKILIIYSTKGGVSKECANMLYGKYYLSLKAVEKAEENTND